MRRLHVVIRVATLAATLSVGFCVLGISSPAWARSHVAIAACRSTQIKETLSTSARTYSAGKTVIVRLSIRNTSSHSCTIAVGPTSPSLAILNHQGDVLWNNCYTGDQPGACAMFLMLHILKPDTAYSLTKSWNQRSGSPAKLVPRGDYVLTSNVSGVGGARRVDFTLVR
jgi:hypothetical protein